MTDSKSLRWKMTRFSSVFYLLIIFSGLDFVHFLHYDITGALGLLRNNVILLGVGKCCSCG